MPTRPEPSWSVPPPRSAEWTLDEIKAGNVLATHSLTGILSGGGGGCAVTFGRIGDDPALVDIVTAHESCSRVHARIAFDSSGSPWLRDLVRARRRLGFHCRSRLTEHLSRRHLVASSFSTGIRKRNVRER